MLNKITSIPSDSDELSEALLRVRRGRQMKRTLLMQKEPEADLTPAMLDSISLFEALGIGYALIGGVAAMCYGRARFTEDVDFVAAPDHRDVLAANSDVMRRCHFDPACTRKLYHDSGLEVDIWKDEHAVGIIERAVTMSLANRPVRVAEVHDLIAMKLRADRPQDDYDVSEIFRGALLQL